MGVETSARNGYPGTRVPESIPGPGYPFHYPGTRVEITTRTLLNEILFSVLFLHSYFVFSVGNDENESFLYYNGGNIMAIGTLVSRYWR